MHTGSKMLLPAYYHVICMHHLDEMPQKLHSVSLLRGMSESWQDLTAMLHRHREVQLSGQAGQLDQELLAAPSNEARVGLQHLPRAKEDRCHPRTADKLC